MSRSGKKGSTRKSGKGVSFKENYVDGVSEPLQSKQHWTLYYFEEHASHCSQCQDPYKVYKSQDGLCNEGLTKAYDVADLLFQLKRDGHVYRHDKKTQQNIRIEVPKDYSNCLKLLKAIKRSGKTFLETSYDRIYHVKPRIDPRKYEVREPGAPVEEHKQESRKVEPKSKRRHSSNPAKSSYGSLMVEDLIEQESRQRRESVLQYETILPQWWDQQHFSPSYQYTPTHDYVNG
jgi:hypothetical protein